MRLELFPAIGFQYGLPLIYSTFFEWYPVAMEFSTVPFCLRHRWTVEAPVEVHGFQMVRFARELAAAFRSCHRLSNEFKGGR
jgi:hypothetical protein